MQEQSAALATGAFTEDATAPSVSSQAAPVQSTERITSLDVLRGFALLGILLMNIVPFGMIGAAYDNPTVTGGDSGLNLGVWAVLHVLAEGKMRCLFSLIFGASVILLTSRLDERRDGADIYYRRTLWLLLFGIAHAYLLWLGEILYPYALCGLALYPFRKMKARGLLILSGVLLVMTSAAYVGHGFETRETIEKGRAANAAERQKQTLTDEQQEQKKEFEEWRKFNQPTPEEIRKDAEEWRGGFLSVLKARAKVVGQFHGEPFYSPLNWDIWSMMLLGMALMKLGVLTGERSAGFYARLALIGYGIGIPLNAATGWLNIQNRFDPVVHSFGGAAYDVGRLTVAAGHMAMLLLLVKSGTAGWLLRRLGAVGQLAFSNYVMHSVICTLLFTGMGFGLYGRLERYQLYYVVAAIWVLQLAVSPVWLRHFRFGPLEWAWRSLTYWKRQPMRLNSAA